MKRADLRGRMRWCGFAAGIAVLVACAAARADGARGPLDSDAAGLLPALDASPHDGTAAVSRSSGRPVPRAADATTPPAIVKILRRGGASRDLRSCGRPLVAADPGATSPASGVCAIQSVLVANAADIVRLCRWLL